MTVLVIDDQIQVVEGILSEVCLLYTSVWRVSLCCRLYPCRIRIQGRWIFFSLYPMIKSVLILRISWMTEPHVFTLRMGRKLFIPGVKITDLFFREIRRKFWRHQTRSTGTAKSLEYTFPNIPKPVWISASYRFWIIIFCTGILLFLRNGWLSFVWR